MRIIIGIGASAKIKWDAINMQNFDFFEFAHKNYIIRNTRSNEKYSSCKIVLLFFSFSFFYR